MPVAEIDETTAAIDVFAETEGAYSPVVPDEFMHGTLELRSLYRAIKSLFVADPEDERPMAKPYAVKRTFELLEPVAYELMRDRFVFPKAFATTDDAGGIRIEWWNGRHRCVTLVIGHNDSARSYIFRKAAADDAGHVMPAFPTLLASNLENLVR